MKRIVLLSILILCVLPFIGNFQVTPYIEDVYTPIENIEFTPSVVGDDYVDSRYSITYGSTVTDPPSGMGNVDDASTDMTEGSYADTAYMTLSGPHDMSTFPPTAWTNANWAQVATGGNPTYYASGTGKSLTHTLTSYGFALGSFTGVRWTWDSKDLTTVEDYWEDGDFYIQTYTGSWVTQWSNVGSWDTWTTLSDTQVTTYSAWQVRFIFVCGVGGEGCGMDNILIEGYTTATYYRFEAIFAFASVDYSHWVDEDLWFDFDVTSTTETIDVYGGTSTNPTTLIADSKYTDFSVDIHSTLTGTPYYIKIVDEVRTGDTDADVWKVDKCYIKILNTLPVVDSIPTCPDLDDTNNIYSMYIQPGTYRGYYSIMVYVSDADGYADIDYVDLYLYDDTRTTNYWIMRYDEDTNTFSEQSDPNDYVNMQDSYATRSGNDIDLRFEIRSHWTHPDVTADDFRVLVYDYATDWGGGYYETNWDWESDLEYEIGYLPTISSDDAYAVDRGDLNEAFHMTGRLSYQGSDLIPPSSAIDVWIAASEYGTNVGPWEDDTVDASGNFDVTCYADNVVGEDAYATKVVNEGEGYSGTDIVDGILNPDFYCADKVSIDYSITRTWTVIGYSVTVSVTATYLYDSTTFVGTISHNFPIGVVTLSSVEKRTWFPTSVSETLYGITGFQNDSVSCTWDDVEISSVAYYWSQYSVDQVWLIWNPSTYYWVYNSSGLSNSLQALIQSYINSTTDDWAIIYSSTHSDLAIGAFDPSWYYVNLTINCEVTVNGVSYDWTVWQVTISVSILHSLQIVSFAIVPTDYYFWIQYQTNLMNASITIWDDVIDSGTLFSDNIYHSNYEGMHQIPVDDTVGVHNMTICITSTGIEYGRVYTVGDYVWWYNFTYVVPVEVTVYETNIVIMNTLGQTVDFATFEVYKNGTRLYYPLTVTYSNLAYNITVKDRWGETLNSTIFGSGDFEYLLVVNVYSFKVMSWYSDFVNFNITHGGITYDEVIAPLETIYFRLYEGSYTWGVNYRNGTSISGNLNLVSSTALVITGSTIADVAGLSASILAMTTEINVTVTATNNYILTIQIDLDNINTTINSQLIYLLLNITNTNSTIYSQTVDLLAVIQSMNSTLYSQSVQILVNLNNINSTLYSQTLSILSTVYNMNSTLYAATVNVHNAVLNANSTLYGMLVDISNMILVNNSAIYGDFIVSLDNIWDSQTELHNKVLATNLKISETKKDILQSFDDTSKMTATMNIIGFISVIFGVIVVALLVKTKRITFFGEGEYEESGKKKEQDEFQKGVEGVKSKLGIDLGETSQETYDRTNDDYRKRHGGV